MSDATVLANARRQAELEARHRDLTKPVPPVGTDGDSIRGVRGFENITDEMLAERATFNLKDHMAKANPIQIITSSQTHTIDLAAMSPTQLDALANATLTEMARRQEKQG